MHFFQRGCRHKSDRYLSKSDRYLSKVTGEQTKWQLDKQKWRNVNKNELELTEMNFNLSGSNVRNSGYYYRKMIKMILPESLNHAGFKNQLLSYKIPSIFNLLKWNLLKNEFTETGFRKNEYSLQSRRIQNSNLKFQQTAPRYPAS